MTKRAHLIFSKTTKTPYLGSEGYVNAMIESCVREAGFDVEPHFLVTHATRPGDRFLPLGHCRIAHDLRAVPPADIALFDDFGLMTHLPGRDVAKKTLVFFHGLAGGQAVWTGPLSREVDLYCANSAYLARALRATLALPDWSRRACADGRAFDVVTSVRLPLPTDRDLGPTTPSSEMELPPTLRDALEGNDMIGHAIQPGKLHLEAVTAIMFFLNIIASQAGHGRRFRLCIFEQDFAAIRNLLELPPQTPSQAQTREALAGALLATGMSLGDLFLPVTWLSHGSLLHLMGRCKFGLSYNTVPEALGFYVLESIAHGCPVYTNGIGNNRHLLPADCGVTVIDPTAAAFGDLAAYGLVAFQIHSETFDDGGVKAACARGADYIRRHHTMDAFRSDMRGCLERLDDSHVAAGHDFEKLRLDLGPLVRAWEPEGSRLVSDNGPRVVSDVEKELIADLRGAPCAAVLPSWRPERVRALEDLFFDGVLALHASET